jgi:ABC-type nitrate/sulfonate/bicarbonate transport system permease component
VAARTLNLRFLSTFSATALAAVRLVTGASLMTHVLPSLGRVLAGYAIGAAVGIVFGLLLGNASSLEGWFRPVLEFLRALPPPLILPLAMVILGVNTPMQVFVIAFGCCWPVLLNALDGARRVDPQYLETARACRTPHSVLLWRVVLPASLPQIFAGLRTALGLALILMVISEMVASYAGLGYLILYDQRTFKVADMYGAVLIIGLIGWLLSLIFRQTEQLALSWHIQRQGDMHV